MDVSQFPGGHSNLTYLVRFGGAELVMRRPPLGPVPPKAHDMAREFRWLAALHPVFPLAPRPYLLCEDPSVIGSVFYVDGATPRHRRAARGAAGLAEHPEQRRRVSEALVDTLADAARGRRDAPPLAAARQAARFRRAAGARLDRAVGAGEDRRRSPTWTRCAAGSQRGCRRIPSGRRSCTAISSSITCCSIRSTVPSVVAVFDWEMSALGDPLVDLGILLAYWTPTVSAGARDALTTVTGRPGYFTRERIIEQYAARSGRDLTNIRFYEIFALFKIAVVIQQIFYRYVAGRPTTRGLRRWAPGSAALRVRRRHGREPRLLR